MNAVPKSAAFFCERMLFSATSYYDKMKKLSLLRMAFSTSVVEKSGLNSNWKTI